jgi:hypothetical protein
MKRLLYIVLAAVVLSTLVLGIGTSAPELDVTGNFLAGGNLGLAFIIVIVAAYTMISLSKRL